MNKLLAPTLAVLIIFTSCSRNDNSNISSNISAEDIQAPNNFDYSTSKLLPTFISVKDLNDKPVKRVRVNFYDADPNLGGRKIATGYTNSSGVLNTEVQVPTYLKEVFVQVNYQGFANIKTAGTAGDVTLDFGGVQQPRSFGKGGSVSQTQTRTRIGSSNVYYIGTFDANGVPDYLITPDTIQSDFLSEISSALPESQSVPVNNPTLIANSSESEAVITDSADVWMTFVSEGASFKNALGYYVYNTNNPPATTSAIDSIFVVFPNASTTGSGGGLQAGDKVYLGRFPAGKTLGWVLFQNSYENGGVNPSKTKFYSKDGFNYESDPSLQAHSVQLIDNDRELFLNGFEDVGRDRSNCDHDFNDLLFYITATPFSALDQTNVPPLNSCTDTDGDGTDDCNDEYPNDPSKSYSIAYDGTLAYEDLWPYKGDFDFNDMVIDYDLTHILNTDNEVVEITGSITLKAIGAGLRNGFGWEFENLTDAAISTATVEVNNTTVDALESGQGLSTFIAFQNAKQFMSPDGDRFVNTEANATYVIPVSFPVSVTFTSPVDPADVGTPPYNAFIFINKSTGPLLRDKEVHLVDKKPTDLADVALFGFGDDDSDPGSGRYYKTQTNQPWALHIYGGFDYPLEKTDITEAYLNFAVWAQSGGQSNTDWYLDINGNRNSSKIYQRP